MKKHILAIITAGALATAGATAPARAGTAEQDFAAILFGAAALSIAANATAHTRVTVRQGPYWFGYRNHPRYWHNRPVHTRPHPGVRHAAYPRQCFKRVRKHNGTIAKLSARCMTRLGWHRHANGAWHKY